MPRLIHLTALLVVLWAAVASAQFVLPKQGTLNISRPMQVAWDRPRKPAPASDWKGPLNITAWLDYLSPSGEEGYKVFNVALGRSSDAPGDAIWDPAGLRAFVAANSTYALSLTFDAKYRMEADDALNSYGGTYTGYSSMSYKIEGHPMTPMPDYSGSARNSASSNSPKPLPPSQPSLPQPNGLSIFPPYSLRGQHPVVRKLYQIAETKKSNLIISADKTDTDSLLALADALGPYIAVFKTHMYIVRDFGDKTVEGLLALAKKHNFLIFEDRKFVDIGATAQKQYYGGALRISEWADFVNVSILGGAGVVEALEQVLTDESFPFRGDRALLILAEMTTVGSLAVDNYTEQCITVARRHTESVVGFVATRRLGDDVGTRGDEDFVVFTTGVSSRQSGDSLGQQYQTPTAAVTGGSDFVIVGRDIYLDQNPVEAAKRCQAEGWAAYEARVTRRE